MSQTNESQAGERGSRNPAVRVEALAEFRATLRRFLHFSEEAATRAGVTPQQHQLLLQIMGAPPGAVASIGYLAERLVLRHHSVVELGDRCESAGLVERTGDPENRRHVVLRLTEKGRALLQSLADVHADELYELAPRLVATLQSFTHRAAADAGDAEAGSGSAER